MLQYQQVKNQELEKNMFALASQLKGLEEEAMKKLHVQEPYSSHHPTMSPSTVHRTVSASTETSISPGASPQMPGKELSREEGDDKVEREKDSVGAVKPDSEVNYGKKNNCLESTCSSPLQGWSMGWWYYV